MTRTRYLLVATLLAIFAAPLSHGQSDPFQSDGLPNKSNPFQPSEPQELVRPTDSLPNKIAKPKTQTEAEPVQRDQAKIEALNERKSETKALLKADTEKTHGLLGQLRNQVSEDRLKQIESMMLESLARRAETEKYLFRQAEELLILEHHIDITRDESNQRLQRASEQLNRSIKELDEVKETRHFLKKQLSGQHESLDVIQVWFAHALESVENPDFQKWVLARLKSAPELTRQLIGQHSHNTGSESTPPDSRLKLALENLAKQPASPVGKIASDIIGLVDPSFQGQYTFPANTTARWPIFSADGRNREQELLEKIDEQTKFSPYMQFSDLSGFVKDFYEIPVVLDINEVEVDTDKEFEVRGGGQVLSLRAYLNQCLPQLGLTFQIRDECLVIMTTEQAKKNSIRRVYQVSPEPNAEQTTALAATLREAINSPELKIIPVNDRLIVIGSEDQHFEASKLITQLLIRK